MKMICLWMATVWGCATGIVQAQSAAPEPTPTQAQSIEVPPGEQPVLTAEGRGVQIYQCKQSAGKTEWTFIAPDATLSVNNAVVATHAAGPAWLHQDGSSVMGEVVAQTLSPTAGALPLLLLRASSHAGNPTGVLANVNFIQRLETTSGLAPTSQCDIGATMRVPYTAVYRFYAPTH